MRTVERGVTVAACLALVLAAGCVRQVAPASGGERFAAVALPHLKAPTPDPAFTRTMSAATTLAAADAPLDACAGPVAIDVQVPGRPVLVSEHDYCGGADWIPDLAAGDAVALDGPGLEAGIYRVDVVDEHRRRDVYVRDLRPEAEVVLQTCISDTRLVLVALTRVASL